MSASVWVVVSAPPPAPTSPELADPEPEVAPVITRVVVNPELDTLRVGDSLTLGAAAETAAGDPVGGQDVTWGVSDPDVARVEGTGAQVIVVAMSPGPVRVQAAIGGVEGAATLEVVATVTALTLSPAGGDIALGEPITLLVTDQDGAELNAFFNSLDLSVATVSGSGVLEGLTPGEVTVVASAAGRSVQGVFTVAAPEPPGPGGDDRQADPEDPTDRFRFIVDVAAMALNPGDVQSATDAEYPPLLRDAGIGGTVLLRFYVEATGEVWRMEIGRGSGRAQLDDAALRVADVIRWSPAMVDGEAVPVLFVFELEFVP